MPEKCYKYCPQGYYYDATSQPTSGTKICSVCGVGHFCPTGATHPAACPAGFVQPSPTGHTCNACPSGKYASPTSGAGTTCMTCPEGYYCDNGLKTGCPKGTQLNKTGSSSSSSCTPCPTGHYASTTGTSQCAQCPAGSFAANKGTTQCAPCPGGTIQTETGGATCTQCPAGQTNQEGTCVWRCTSAGQYWSQSDNKCVSCSGIIGNNYEVTMDQCFIPSSDTPSWVTNMNNTSPPQIYLVGQAGPQDLDTANCSILPNQTLIADTSLMTAAGGPVVAGLTARYAQNNEYGSGTGAASGLVNAHGSLNDGLYGNNYSAVGDESCKNVPGNNNNESQAIVGVCVAGPECTTLNPKAGGGTAGTAFLQPSSSGAAWSWSSSEKPRFAKVQYQGARYRGWCPQGVASGTVAESSMPWGCTPTSSWIPGCAGTATSFSNAQATINCPSPSPLPSPSPSPSPAATLPACSGVAPVSTELSGGIGSWACDDKYIGHVSSVPTTANSTWNTGSKHFICCPAKDDDGAWEDGNIWTLLPINPTSAIQNPGDWACSSQRPPNVRWVEGQFKARLNNPPVWSCPGTSCSGDHAVNGQFCGADNGYICQGGSWGPALGGYSPLTATDVGTINDNCT